MVTQILYYVTVEGMHFCVGSLLYLIIVYTQSLSKMLDIHCAPLLRLFQEAVARNKQMIEDLTRENNQLLKDLVESDVT